MSKPETTTKRTPRPGADHPPWGIRAAAAVLAGLAATACITAPAAPPHPAPAVPVAEPSTRGTVTVWQRQASFPHAPLIKRLTLCTSHFDVIEPGVHSPGHWNVTYHLRLSRSPDGTDTAATVAVWVASHNQTPARRVVARPWFDGRQWLLWVAPSGQFTFTLAYTAAAEPDVYSTRALARRWDVGTVDFLDMTAWLKRNGYLPDKMRLAGYTFGWEYAPPAPDLKVRRFSFRWAAR
jgi:hypothetical protein